MFNLMEKQKGLKIISLFLYTIGVFFLGCGFQLYSLTGTMGDYMLWTEVELVEGCGHSWYRLISGSGGTVAIPVIMGLIFLIIAIVLQLSQFHRILKEVTKTIP